MADRFLKAVVRQVRETTVCLRYDDVDYDLPASGDEGDRSLMADDRVLMDDVVRRIVSRSEDSGDYKKAYEFVVVGLEVSSMTSSETAEDGYHIEEAPPPGNWFQRRFERAIKGYQDPTLNLPGVEAVDFAFLGGFDGDDGDGGWRCATVVRRFKLAGEWAERVRKLHVADLFDVTGPKNADGSEEGTEEGRKEAAMEFCEEIQGFLQVTWRYKTIMSSFCRAFGWPLTWVKLVE